MSSPAGVEERQEIETPRRAKRIAWLPWPEILVAAIPLALAVYYLVVVAPAAIPVPEGASVPFPEATRFLERVSEWCGERPAATVLIGLGLLALGLPARVLVPRYYYVLAVLAIIALGFAYLSISAPIDRLIHQVEENLPDERPLPDFLPGDVRGSDR